MMLFIGFMSNWQVFMGKALLVYLMPPCRQCRKKDNISKEGINATEPCILTAHLQARDLSLPRLHSASAPLLIWFHLVQAQPSCDCGKVYWRIQGILSPYSPSQQVCVLSPQGSGLEVSGVQSSQGTGFLSTGPETCVPRMGLLICLLASCTLLIP